MVQKFRVTEGHAKGVRKVLPSGETEQEREYRLLCQWWRETLVDRVYYQLVAESTTGVRSSADAPAAH